MDPSDDWILPTEKHVESTVFQKIVDKPEEMPYSISSLFMVDPDSAEWVTYFSPQEIQVIGDRGTMTPIDLEEELQAEGKGQLLVIFQKIEDLHTQFQRNHSDSGTHRKNILSLIFEYYDHLPFATIEWLFRAILDFFWVIDNRPSFANPSESHMAHNVWGPTVDRILQIDHTTFERYDS